MGDNKLCVSSTVQMRYVCYLPFAMSNARMPKAMTMVPEPTTLQIVIDSTAPPNMISAKNTRTIVRRFPTEVTTGPHSPNSI